MCILAACISWIAEYVRPLHLNFILDVWCEKTSVFKMQQCCESWGTGSLNSSEGGDTFCSLHGQQLVNLVFWNQSAAGRRANLLSKAVFLKGLAESEQNTALSCEGIVLLEAFKWNNSRIEEIKEKKEKQFVCEVWKEETDEAEEDKGCV